MKKIYYLLVISCLLTANFFCWKEIFVLAQNELKIVFFDVGQGDSIFIQTPQTHQILIDGGPSSIVLEKLGKQMPFWDRTLDVVILTHPEIDHMKGLFDVLERYKVSYILWTGVEKEGKEYQRWLEILKEKKNQGVKVLPLDATYFLKAGKAILNVLYPFNNFSGVKINNINDTSLVFKLIFGNNRFLLPADISSRIEKKLNSLGAEVLKVAHHGSKYSTSEDFLRMVNSYIAIISVGKNRYGHPHKEVLERLRNKGIEILRTDEKGDITILSDGKNLKLKTQK